MKTKFMTKCQILAELWIDYRDDEQFKDFIEYADLGLPLAYSISNGIVEKTENAKSFVNESFELFLASLGIEDDTGFEDLEDVLDSEVESNE